VGRAHPSPQLNPEGLQWTPSLAADVQAFRAARAVVAAQHEQRHYGRRTCRYFPW
jgi:hypothetical protein